MLQVDAMSSAAAKSSQMGEHCRWNLSYRSTSLRGHSRQQTGQVDQPVQPNRSWGTQMAYRNKLYIAFDGDNDMRYYNAGQ